MPPENKENQTQTQPEIKNKVVKTYAEDMARTIETGTGGLIKKMIHGEEEHEKERENYSPMSRRNQIFMTIGALLIISAVLLLGFLVISRGASTVGVEGPLTPLIFSDKTNYVEIVDFKKEKIAQTITNKVMTTSVKEVGVEGIYLTENKNIIGFRRFISLLESSFVPPDTNFLSDHFMMGAVNSGTKDFFILLKVRSMLDVFDDMRAWEDEMFLDLYDFFNIKISAENSFLFTADFENEIVENKNARVLYDKNKETVLMYVFANNTSIVISNSKDAVREIILRLNSSQVEK